MRTLASTVPHWGSRDRHRVGRGESVVRSDHGSNPHRRTCGRSSRRSSWSARTGGPRARAVARAFHACLRNLESKSASRAASRWGAVLGTAAVGSVSVGEMGNTREAALQGLVHGALPAVLEVGAALKSAQAWEVEAGLLYDDLAWFLYDELWDISGYARPDLSPSERRDQVALVIDPLLDAPCPTATGPRSWSTCSGRSLPRASSRCSSGIAAVAGTRELSRLSRPARSASRNAANPYRGCHAELVAGLVDVVDLVDRPPRLHPGGGEEGRCVGPVPCDHRERILPERTPSASSNGSGDSTLNAPRCPPRSRASSRARMTASATSRSSTPP